MSVYNEISECPICGDRTTIQIRAYGDYDGPDKPRETNPDHCKKCAGIKMLSPELWQRMKTVWENAEKKLAALREKENKIYDQYITKHEVMSRLHHVSGFGEMSETWKIFKKELNEGNKIAKKCEGKQYGHNGDWALSKALSHTLWRFYEDMEKGGKKFLDDGKPLPKKRAAKTKG